MILERATILSTAHGFAWVACDAQRSCERCAQGRGCGGALLGPLLGDRLHRVRAALPRPGYGAGDRVLIGVSESALLRAAGVVYGLPVLLLALGAVLGGALSAGTGELPAIAGGGLGLAAGLAMARRADRGAASDPRYQPVVLGRAD